MVAGDGGWEAAAWLGVVAGVKEGATGQGWAGAPGAAVLLAVVALT